MKLHLLISLFLIYCGITTFAEAVKRSLDEQNTKYNHAAERGAAKRCSGDEDEKPTSAITAKDEAITRLCLVCQENLISGEDIQTLVCSHSFHTSCIIPWFISHNTCPTCRTIQPPSAAALLPPPGALSAPDLPIGYSVSAQLFDAVITSDTPTVRALVAAGVNVNDQNWSGGIPLHYAAGSGHTEIVQILLAAGSLVDFQDSNQGTPLHAAAAEGHTEIVLLLTTAGANTEIRGLCGFTALHLAATEGHTETLQALIAPGGNVNSHCAFELTPLHLAAYYGNILTVQALLAAPDILPSLTDTRGKTAADIAQTDEIQALIEADLNTQTIATLPAEAKSATV